MIFILLSITVLSVVSLIIGIWSLYIYFTKQYKYWGKRNILYAKPQFPFGNLRWMNVEGSFSLFKELYDRSKTERYYGLWFLDKPALMVNDLDLIKKIFVENYEKFSSHDTYFAPDDDPISVNLFNLKGDAHRNLKANLTPIFRPLKLQATIPSLNESKVTLENVLMKKARHSEVIDVKDISTRFATDAMFSAFFGIDINFIKDPNSSLIGTESLRIAAYNWVVMLKFFIAIYMPGLAKALKIPFISKKLFNFFNSLFTKIMESRKENDETRFDAMQHLTDLVNKGYLDYSGGKMEPKQKFTIEHLTSQALSFITPAYINTSKTISSVLYELAVNQTLQRKLRKEINTILAQNNGEITYEAICHLEYLHQVIDETLRKYPTSSIILRACVKDFKDPDSHLTIEKGTYVLIPTVGLHWDKKYFPNPEIFDPDRFSHDKKNSTPSCAYLPYGKGPRACIAQKFSPLLLAANLIALLSKFQFDIPDQQSSKNLEFDPKIELVVPNAKTALRISIADH